MSSSDDDMLVDPEGFYTRALADFDAYAKSIGLEGSGGTTSRCGSGMEYHT